MSNWRADIKKEFSNWLNTALGNSMKYFEGYNNQKQNSDEEETRPELGIFFEYVSVSPSVEQLGETNKKANDYKQILIRLHVCFNSYNGDNQDRAYDYAYKINQVIEGQKLTCMLGKVQNAGEGEDSNHRAPYDYQMDFELKVYTSTPSDDQFVKTKTDPVIDGDLS